MATIPTSGRCDDALQIGTTYSPRQSQYLSLDEQQTYLSILESGFDLIRLGTYWNAIETQPDVFDFSIIDWQLQEAKTNHIPVVLTVGMKAPRWPEYFIPDWVIKEAHLGFGADVATQTFLRIRALRFISTVVRRYADEEIIRYWQVENEPLDRSGPRFWWISDTFLRQEVELVRRLDGHHRPIVLTAATFPNRLLRFLARLLGPRAPIPRVLPLCDILGINVYPIIGQRFLRLHLYFWSGAKRRADYFGGLRALIEAAGKTPWITELQAEPWEPGTLVYTAHPHPPSRTPEATQGSFQEFRSLGFKTIFLWGAEYWHYRMIRYQERRWWEMLKDRFGTSSRHPPGHPTQSAPGETSEAIR